MQSKEQSLREPLGQEEENCRGVFAEGGRGLLTFSKKTQRVPAHSTYLESPVDTNCREYSGAKH